MPNKFNTYISTCFLGHCMDLSKFDTCCFFPCIYSSSVELGLLNLFSLCFLVHPLLHYFCLFGFNKFACCLVVFSLLDVITYLTCGTGLIMPLMTETGFKAAWSYTFLNKLNWPLSCLKFFTLKKWFTKTFSPSIFHRVYFTI